MKKTIKLFLILVIGLMVAFCTKSYAETYKGFEVAGEIEIPAIRFKSPVLSEATGSSMKNAPAVLYGEGLNKVGNTVVAGLNYKDGTLFSDVIKVKKDDIIYIKDAQTSNRIPYKVYNVLITTPEDTSFYNRDTLGSREITLTTQTDDAANRYIVLAKETAETEDNGQYKLSNIEPVTVGSNKYVVEIGKRVSAKVGLVNQLDGTSKEIDTSKLKIEASNLNLVNKETDGLFTAKAEGTVKINYTYIDNGKTYEYSEEKFIVSDRFSVGDIPALTNSIVNLKNGGNSENVAINMVQGGTYSVVYPTGYDPLNYYLYNWTVESNQIAKIDKVSDNEVKISPVGKGTTKVICTISTADGKESFKKTITVNVTDNGSGTGDVTPVTTQTQNSTPTTTTNTQPTGGTVKITNQNTKNNQTTNNNIKNTNTAPTVLPKAGLVYGITIFIIIATVCGIVFYYKYRNIDK